MRVSAKFENTFVLRGWVKAPSQSGVSAVLAPISRFVASACLRCSRLMTRKPSSSDCEGGRCGSSSGTFICKNASLSLIVSRGKARGFNSPATPRVATLPASSRAVIAIGVPAAWS